jgi:hypothetical protein
MPQLSSFVVVGKGASAHFGDRRRSHHFLRTWRVFPRLREVLRSSACSIHSRSFEPHRILLFIWSLEAASQIGFMNSAASFIVVTYLRG